MRGKLTGRVQPIVDGHESDEDLLHRENAGTHDYIVEDTAVQRGGVECETLNDGTSIQAANR